MFKLKAPKEVQVQQKPVHAAPDYLASEPVDESVGAVSSEPAVEPVVMSCVHSSPISSININFDNSLYYNNCNYLLTVKPYVDCKSPWSALLNPITSKSIVVFVLTLTIIFLIKQLDADSVEPPAPIGDIEDISKKTSPVAGLKKIWFNKKKRKRDDSRASVTDPNAMTWRQALGPPPVDPSFQVSFHFLLAFGTLDWFHTSQFLVIALRESESAAL